MSQFQLKAVDLKIFIGYWKNLKAKDLLIKKLSELKTKGFLRNLVENQKLDWRFSCIDS